MSDAPSWLTEEDTAKAAAKIAKSSTTKKIVENPAVQSSAKATAKAAAAAAVDSNAPAWAARDSEAAHPSKDVEAQKAASPAAATAAEFHIEEATLRAMQQWHLAMRILYMAAAIFMGVAAGLSLNGQSNLGKAFFAIYVLGFSLIICCFEFALNAIARWIAVNFGFMYTLSGRWVFMLFVGFMSFSLGPLGIGAMCGLYAAGLFHAYIMCKFPRFEEYLRKKHYYEGKRYEQAAKANRV